MSAPWRGKETGGLVGPREAAPVSPFRHTCEGPFFGSLVVRTGGWRYDALRGTAAPIEYLYLDVPGRRSLGEVAERLKAPGCYRVGAGDFLPSQVRILPSPLRGGHSGRNRAADFMTAGARVTFVRDPSFLDDASAFSQGRCAGSERSPGRCRSPSRRPRAAPPERRWPPRGLRAREFHDFLAHLRFADVAAAANPLQLAGWLGLRHVCSLVVTDPTSTASMTAYTIFGFGPIPPAPDPAAREHLIPT
jgi:hypothetical protein